MFKFYLDIGRKKSYHKSMEQFMKEKIDIDKLYSEFQKSIEENDKLTQEEMATKSRLQLTEEYNQFIKKNNCKIKGQNNDNKTKKQ